MGQCLLYCFMSILLKLEAALRSEKAKHEEELLKIEQGMKESFISEMQIERQKHQEMLLKMQDDHQSTVNQVRRVLYWQD